MASKGPRIISKILDVRSLRREKGERKKVIDEFNY